MTFYIAWCKENEPFNPTQHCREDLKVLRLRIIEKEGHAPKAWVTIPNPWYLNEIPKISPHAMLSYKPQDQKDPVLLFWGCLGRMPMKIEGEVVELELTSHRENQDDALKDLKDSMMVAPYWDPLFISHEKRQDPQWIDILDAYSKVLYWDRLTGVPSLCDYFQGQQTLEIQGKHFANTLSVKVTETPLRGVQVNIHANWKQRFQGEVTLDHLLGAKFSEGMMSTLTPKFCDENWWKPGTRLKDTGYEILSATLQEETPALTGVLNLYPPCSKPLYIGEGKEARKVRLKRAWYRMHLKLGWSYRQRRYEHVTFTLEQETQDIGVVGGHTKHLNLYVHDIQDDLKLGPWIPERFQNRGDHVLMEEKLYQCLKTHRASKNFISDARYWKDLGPYAEVAQAQSMGTFFTTQRGHQAIQHALEVAKCYLGASSRAVNIDFECSLDLAQSLSCQHSVLLHDSRLPGGKALGKVTQLILDVSGQTGLSKGLVTVSCAIGTGRKPEKSTTAEDQKKLCSIPSGIVFESVEDDLPRGGITFPQKLGASDIARDILIHNDAPVQQDQLGRMTFSSPAKLKEALGKMPTRVKIILEDLRAFPRLDHHIQVKVLNRWSAPAHIQIGGNNNGL